MEYSAENASAVLSAVGNVLEEDIDPAYKLKRVWWTLLLTRSRALTVGLRALLHDVVYGGPFKGMKLTEQTINGPGCGPCVLLGCYEQELHAVFEKIIATPYTRIVNIGCSVGYYAVGLALRMPHIKMDAFDIDPEARKKCAALAELNGVRDRVSIRGEFVGEDFAAYADEKTLVLVDIEGAELALLDVTRFPSLKRMDVVVELHDLMNRETSKTINQRFEASHRIEPIPNKTILPDVEGFMPASYVLDPFDHLLFAWEGRGGATPWGVYWTKE